MQEPKRIPAESNKPVGLLLQKASPVRDGRAFCLLLLARFCVRDHERLLLIDAAVRICPLRNPLQDSHGKSHEEDNREYGLRDFRAAGFVGQV